MSDALIGILGGSGLYQLDALAQVREERVETPYGAPSDVIVTGTLDGIRVAFLARHGRGHRLLPSEVPYRANIYAFKQLGVRYLLSFSAVGSLREDVAPLDFVLPDQYIDLSRRRESTFFGNGVVAHVSMAQPVCPVTREVLARAVHGSLGADAPRLHQGGTYVCIEGPQFSSLAESNWYRSMGASVIGMTNMPEAKLAREAQMAYASLAMVTDYDCWHPREAHVTADMAIANLMTNAERAKLVAAEAIRVLGAEKPDSPAHNALQSAVVTPAEAIPETLKRQLAVLLR
ncbi:S-methyl-5'-thioadenosine phosphorylase [Ralstonia pickettii]|jgi:5'-methylthioadenosine phosphorylase|uniref:S-methyl-5'-thioadenosine phosphorylase n=1 Tax=Ralstonia pickettii TaxID=329 RepID=A0ABM9ILE3_RALPI|nr:S-methyl-5'-thioadenosine phosphorylase [Ralstonia pickettii]CAJ0723298.1 S-methyl-5'-thioadenosine phosphorylase [Ralstonia pickettii]